MVHVGIDGHQKSSVIDVFDPQTGEHRLQTGFGGIWTRCRRCTCNVRPPARPAAHRTGRTGLICNA